MLTLPEADHAHLAVARIRAINPGVPILARAHRRDAGDALRAAGATVVVEPEVEAAARFIQHALEHLALPDRQLDVYLARFRDAMSAGHPSRSAAEPGLPEVREVPLPEGPLDGVTLRDAHIRERFGVTVVAIARDGARSSPTRRPTPSCGPATACGSSGCPRRSTRWPWRPAACSEPPLAMIGGRPSMLSSAIVSQAALDPASTAVSAGRPRVPR